MRFIHRLSTTRPKRRPLSTFAGCACASMVESGIVVLPRKRKEAERRAEPLSRNPFLRLRVAFAPSSVLSAAPLLPMRQKGPIMAQQQALITITGYVGANPTQFNKDGMPHASSFRMASTRRYFDNRTQQWKDLPTTWDHGESVPEPIREHLPISEERASRLS